MHFYGYLYGALYMLVNLPFGSTVGLVPELYCGLDTCYEVLGIKRDEFDRTQLSKIYRTLAKKYHPDRVQNPKEKPEAEVRFRVIAAAYETLKDEQTKNDYDYYLDNPEQRMYNYWQYYRRRMVPKVDVSWVILGTVTLISVVQYFSAKQKHSEALGYAVTVGKYRNAAINLGVERGLLEFDNKGKLKKLRNQNNEDIIRSIIEENMDVQGGYKKESIYDTLAWYIIASPIYLGRYFIWYYQWIVKYWIKKEPYDDEAKMYIIRKQLGVSESRFQQMVEEDGSLMEGELWIAENFQRWKAAKEAEELLKLQQSGKYKRYKRYMKNSAGTISFLDEE